MSYLLSIVLLCLSFVLPSLARGEISSSPSKSDNVFKVTAIAGITAGLMTIDNDIRHWTKKRTQGLDALEKVIEPLGRLELQALGGGALLAAGYFSKDRKLVESTLSGFEAAAFTGGVVGTIKLLTGRVRPSEEKGAGDFFKGHDSFPSGHAAFSFAWAAAFSEYYPESRVIPLVSYTLATMVSLSRLESDRHWASDAFFGACLGFGIGKGLSHRHLKNKDKSISLLPLLNEDSLGVSALFKF